MATITNKQSISTTVDQADIFLLSQAGTRFINRGNLSAAGTQSSTIDITADDVTVQNFGDLTASGADSPVILAGHRDDPVDGVSVINFGSILNNAPFVDLNSNGVIDVDEYFPDGIDYYGTNGLIENRGTITVPTRDGAAIGLLASDTTVVNSGEIQANIVGIIVDEFGGGHDRNTVINEGLIHVTGGTFGVGIHVLSNDNTVINEGDIIAEGDEYIGILLEGTGNHGENDGTITVSGNDSTAVYLYGADHSFINKGTIGVTGTGGFAVAVRFGSDEPAGTTTGTFTNLGSVNGDVLGSEGNETFINHGPSGPVALFGGNDTYVAGKGSVNTGVSLGEGDDLLVLEKGFGNLGIEDFVEGAGTEDVIDVSALGISSFDEVMSHVSGVLADAVEFTFGSATLFLGGVQFGALSPEDFIFADAGQAALIGGGIGSTYDLLIA